MAVWSICRRPQWHLTALIGPGGGTGPARFLQVMGCDMVYPVAVNTHFYGTGNCRCRCADMTCNLERNQARRNLLLARAAGLRCGESLSQTAKQAGLSPRPQLNASLSDATALLSMNCSSGQFLRAEHDWGRACPLGRYWNGGMRINLADLAADRYNVDSELMRAPLPMAAGCLQANRPEYWASLERTFQNNSFCQKKKAEH